MKPSVSVLMPCYNSEQFIDEAIRSVVSQTHESWELLVIDDSSTDRTRDVVTAWCRSEPRIKVQFNDKNKGVAFSRNRALQASMGRYIAFLDSDDLWHPRKLEIQLDFTKNERAPLTYTEYEEIDEDGRRIATRDNLPESVTYQQMLTENVIGCPTALYDTHILGKVEVPQCFHEDYATWLKILKRGYIAKGLAKSLASYRVRGRGKNRNKLRAAWQRWCIYRDIERIPLPQSSGYFLRYAFKSLRRRKYRLIGLESNGNV